MKRNAVGYQQTLRKVWGGKLQKPQQKTLKVPLERPQTYMMGKLFMGVVAE